jgi:hypothetical protein
VNLPVCRRGRSNARRLLKFLRIWESTFIVLPLNTLAWLSCSLRCCVLRLICCVRRPPHRQHLDPPYRTGPSRALPREHGTGMIHLAQRPDPGALITDMQYRFGGSLAKVMAKRIGLEKHGDSIAIFVSLKGEPMHQFGPPITVHFERPFYAGIGFCSHLPDKSDTAVFSNVILENSAGAVH